MTLQVTGQEIPATSRIVSQAARAAYLEKLLAAANTLATQSGLALAQLRDIAKALVKEQTFPSTRNENWRFTDLSGLLSTDYQVIGSLSSLNLDLSSLANQLESFTLSEGPRLVFVNGHYAAELSSSLDNLPAGVTIAPLSQLPLDSVALYLAKVQGNNEVFTALNTAGFADVAVIQVEKNQVIEQPIQVVNLVTTVTATNPAVTAVVAPSLFTQPRCLVVAQPHSDFTLVEIFGSEGVHFTNGVTEVWVQDNAQINHIRLQQESGETVHIGKTAISQARDSRYTCTAINLGAKLSRHNLEVFQTGPQTETYLNGLNAIQGNQVSDTHSLLALAYPHGTAQQLHKNIVDHRAHAVFNGRVYVPHSAQLTQASQLNRNLLLSSKARVDTKPELDIVADNVKCAHGATVSQLKPDEIFYLQSRGIDESQAQRLLIYAFAMEIIEKVSISTLRERLTQHITQWTQ